MRIDNQDIIQATRQLRDEENQQLHVSAWNHRSNRFHVPAWLIATPAAAIIGFVLGFWTKNQSPTESPLETIVDTIYIKVREPLPQQEIIAEAIPTTPTSTPKQVIRSASGHRTQSTVGKSFADDHIRYDLLSRN